MQKHAMHCKEGDTLKRRSQYAENVRKIIFIFAVGGVELLCQNANIICVTFPSGGSQLYTFYRLIVAKRK